MKKKLIALLLLSTMAVSICACGNSAGTAETAAPEEAAQAGDASEESAEEATGETSMELTGDASEELVGAATMIGNPWRDCTEEEAAQLVPNGFSAPDGARNVKWSICKAPDETKLPGPMVQLTFEADGVNYTAREQAVPGTEITDISGMYYEWTHKEDGVLQNWAGGKMPCRFFVYAGEDTDVQVCLWFDIETGYAYSLSVAEKDLDGFDIQAMAEAIYDPAKQDSASIPDETSEEAR